MATDTYQGTELEALADMPNYYSWILEAFEPRVRGEVIEYGAGVGTVSARLLPLAQTLTLVEPAANLVGPLRKRFGDLPAVRIVASSLESHAAALAPGSVDTLVLVNVLEHIEDDRQALANLMAALRPGGHLLVFVPALQCLMSKFDRAIGHFRRYHKPDLLQKVVAAGGRVEHCRYMDMFGTVPWFFLNKLLGSTSFNAALVALNDRYVVPPSRWIERALPPPFGKNLILVASKP